MKSVIGIGFLFVLSAFPLLFSACGNNGSGANPTSPSNPVTVLITSTFTATATATATRNHTPVVETPTPESVPTYSLYATLGQPGSGGTNGNFVYPYSVAVGAGYIAVGDQGISQNNGNVQVFDRSGNYLYSIPMHNANCPVVEGVMIDSSGELYVVGQGAGAEVDGYNLGSASAVYDYTWTGQGTIDGAFSVRLDSNGNLVVAESGFILNLSWTDDEVLSRASSPIQTPTGLAVDTVNNSVFVADSVDNQVEWLDEEYGSAILPSFKGAAWTLPLATPQDIVRDSQSNLWVSDSPNQRIVYATEQGGYLEELDGFNNPLGLAMDSADDLFVVNNGNGQIEEYVK